MLLKKKGVLTKADYVDRFVARMKRISDPKEFAFDEAEEWAYTAWTQHSREGFRHLEDKSPEKDAEMELCWRTGVPTEL